MLHKARENKQIVNYIFNSWSAI